MILFAGAVMIVLGVGCEKNDPKPKWKPLPPLELDDELYYYLRSGEKRYYERRKDRVAIKTGSYEQARVMSMEEILQFGDVCHYLGEWAYGAIDSTQTDLSDVLALPGALDATYGLKSENGGLVYPLNQVLATFVSGTPEKALEKTGLSQYVADIHLFEGSGIYLITFDLRAEETLRICRALHETKECTIVQPDLALY